MNTVKAKSSKKNPKRRVTHIRIHHAENGFTVHHEREPMPRTMGKMTSPMYEPDKEHVFTDKQAMLDHVGGLADQMGATQQEPDADDAQTAA